MFLNSLHSRMSLGTGEKKKKEGKREGRTAHGDAEGDRLRTPLPCITAAACRISPGKEAEAKARRRGPTCPGAGGLPVQP